MQRVDVTVPASSGAQYPILIGHDIFKKLQEVVPLTSQRKVAVVTDDNLAAHWLPTLRAALPKNAQVLMVPSGEEAKTLESAETLWNSMHMAGLDRTGLIVAFGGGSVGDLAGFCASTYMRGMGVVHVATSLLAQVDSSIGGKTAINHGGVKNLIGTFHTPLAVVADVATLTTLPEKEFASGCAEIVKHAVISEKSFLDQLAAQPLDPNDSERLVSTIARACAVKKHVVEQDPFEKGPRKVLNLGHTVGHALEAMYFKSESPLLHGEAVSLGLVVAMHIAVQMKRCTTAELNLVEKALTGAKLPTRLDCYKERRRIIQIMKSDKKTVGGSFFFVLPKGIGKVDFDIPVAETVLLPALQYLSTTSDVMV